MKKLCIAFLLLITTTVTFADARLQPLEGEAITLSSLKGKWVFINFWAEWCETCRVEIPEFNRFFERHKNKNVALYAVNYDRLTGEEQKIAMDRHNILYPALTGNPAAALKLGHIPGVPVTFVYNPEGKLVKTLFGGQSEKELEEAMS